MILPNEKNETCVLVRRFSIFALGTIALYWFITIFTRSAYIDAYFVTDHTDTAMDYFNMLANIFHGDPYYANANYPAICFLFWKVMAHMMPIPWIEEYGTGAYLRGNMIAQLGYFLFVMTCLLMICFAVEIIVGENRQQKWLTALTILLSGPMFFLLERGNILLIALAFSFVFIAFYDDETAWKRYIAYTALALAAAIKLYPALLGLLVLRKKRYKETVIVVLMGILFFSLPFFAFGGIKTIQNMLVGVTIASNIQADIGLGYNFSLINMVELFAACFGHRIESIPGWFSMLAVLGGLGLFFVSTEEWQRIYAMVITGILFPSFSYTYTLTMLFLPMVVFFHRSSKEEQGRFRILYAVLFYLLIIPYATPFVDAVNQVLELEYLKFPVSWGTIIMSCAIIVMTLLILIDSILRRTQKADKQAMEA